MSERHPDIEVYVKNSSARALIAWVTEISEAVTEVKTRGLSHEFNCTINGVDIPVLVEERVVGKPWISIWFNSDQTPWAVDLECATAITQALDVQTRCIVNGWSEGDEPDEWWRVTADGPEKIIWTT